VCNYCSVGCNITVKVKNADLFFVVGAPPDAEPNKGELCMWEDLDTSIILTAAGKMKPMVKKGAGLFPVSWDEAFRRNSKRGCPEPSPIILPIHIMVAASPKLTNEELYLAGRFARAAIGTNNITSFIN